MQKKNVFSLLSRDKIRLKVKLCGTFFNKWHLFLNKGRLLFNKERLLFSRGTLLRNKGRLLENKAALSFWRKTPPTASIERGGGKASFCRRQKVGLPSAIFEGYFLLLLRKIFVTLKGCKIFP